jgi:uncharacterized protein (TIGR04255 family)
MGVVMGRKMSNAPVYFTIAQVRFNTLLALDSYAPTIQENMRKDGFPDFQKGIVATFNLNLGAPTESPPAQVPVGQMVRYVFSDMEKTTAFVLDQGSLSFQTTEYDVFETFSARFLQGLGILHTAVNLSYSDRIGFRYLDAVFPKEGESLSDYLDVSVLGLVGKLEGSLVHSFSETLTKTKMANVLARVIVQSGPIGFPPDLQPMSSQLAERFRALDGLHGIIDTDGSNDKREAFSLGKVKSKLIAIHDEMDAAFKAMVTPRALQIWK